MQNFTSLTQMLKTSSLREMFEQILAQVKAQPQDIKAREVLFKLYCVDGVWDKALLQLQTMALMDAEYKKQIELYKNLVFSEMQRVQVLAGERRAATLQGDFPEWMEKLHQANVQQYQGKVEQSESMRLEAFDEAPESAGSSDVMGTFGWIADSDGRLGPLCEFICAGGYRWVPFSAIRSLEVKKPGDLLDLLWVPATMQVGDDSWYGYIPARYPIQRDDAQEIKLGFRTEWASLSDILSTGSGRKVFITDQNEHSVMEIGAITFG